MDRPDLGKLTGNVRDRWRRRPTVGQMVRTWIVVSLDLGDSRPPSPIEEERWKRQAEAERDHGPRW